MPFESFTTTLILTVPAVFIVVEYFSLSLLVGFALYSLSSIYTETVTCSGSISFPSSSVFLVYPVIEATLTFTVQSLSSSYLLTVKVILLPSSTVVLALKLCSKTTPLVWDLSLL